MDYHTSIRTLIPEADSYGIAILVVVSLGSFMLAGDVWSRWTAGTRISVFHVYCGIIGFLCAWGFLVVDSSLIPGSSALGWVLSLPVGLAVGHLARRGDRAVVRAFNRRTVMRRRDDLSSRPGAAMMRPQVRPSFAGTLPFTGGQQARRRLITRRTRRSLPSSFAAQNPTLPVLVIGAGFEELVFRGFLVSVCFLLPHAALTALALVGTVAAFALFHVWFGWAHVLAKLPLGLLCLVAVLALGTVLPAIVAHVLFNFDVWKDLKSTSPAPAVAQRREHFGLS